MKKFDATHAAITYLLQAAVGEGVHIVGFAFRFEGDDPGMITFGHGGHDNPEVYEALCAHVKRGKDDGRAIIEKVQKPS